MHLLQFMLDGMKDHPYMTIISAAIWQGRVTAIFAGAFIAQGYVNPVMTYIIFVVMDISGDFLYYRAGRVGGHLARLFIKKSWSKKKKSGRVGQALERGLPLGLFIAKVTGVLSKPVIVAVGAAKMPLPKFWGITVPCTLISFVIYLAIGYLFGQSIL